jgi:hypothetical protein
MGVQQVNLRNAMAGIDANLDDLQSGVEACTRAAHTIQRDAAAVDQQVSKQVEHADLIGLLVRRAKELQACALGQSGALRELRQNVALLRAELKLKSSPAVRRRRSGTRDGRGKSKDLDSVSSPSRE